jgi:hypothetical protein
MADEQEPVAAHRATNEAMATARVNRKAALAAADWALRSGASLEVLRDILSALGIDAEAVSPEAVIPVITLP